MYIVRIKRIGKNRFHCFPKPQSVGAVRKTTETVTVSTGGVTSPRTKDSKRREAANWASGGTCYCVWTSIIESVVSKNRAKNEKGGGYVRRRYLHCLSGYMMTAGSWR